MARICVVVVVIVATCIAESIQQEGGLGCEISSGLGVADQLNFTVSATSNCSRGTISWHYPMGTLTVNFPRTVLPALAHARKKMRLCFRGGIGQGVTSIVQKLQRKRNRVKIYQMKLVDSRTQWVCGRPSRRPAGIQVTLVAQSKRRPEFYQKAVHYKAEEVGPGPKNSGGNRGNNRHEKGRHRNRGSGRRNHIGNHHGNRRG